MLAASHTEVMSESFLGTLYNDNNIVIWNFECSKVSLQRYFSDTKAKRLLPFALCDIYLVSSEYLLKYLANLFFCLMHVEELTTPTPFLDFPGNGLGGHWVVWEKTVFSLYNLDG